MQWASVVSECGMTLRTQLALAICLWELKPGKQEHIIHAHKMLQKDVRLLGTSFWVVQRIYNGTLEQIHCVQA